MKHGNKGFTLVELLIVVAIIGILAAIAIPTFSKYREQAYCSQIKSDLANLAISQEAYFYDNDLYLAATKNANGSSNVPQFFWSDGVTPVTSSGNTTSWLVQANHSNCSAGPFTWNSASGGLQ
jgi:type IV pilus assembly protein PilA